MVTTRASGTSLATMASENLRRLLSLYLNLLIPRLIPNAGSLMVPARESREANAHGRVTHANECQTDALLLRKKLQSDHHRHGRWGCPGARIAPQTLPRHRVAWQADGGAGGGTAESLRVRRVQPQSAATAAATHPAGVRASVFLSPQSSAESSAAHATVLSAALRRAASRARTPRARTAVRAACASAGPSPRDDDL